MWHKKIEKSLMAGVDAKDLGLKAEKARHEARLLEIEKVKQQREQRDREKMEKEQERELMQREEALIEAVELEKKEEEFHVAQAKMRSDIRVREGRARATWWRGTSTRRWAAASSTRTCARSKSCEPHHAGAPRAPRRRASARRRRGAPAGAPSGTISQR